MITDYCPREDSPTKTLNDRRYRHLRARLARIMALRDFACDRNSEAIIHRVLYLLFATDVSLRCLDRSVPKQKPNLFEFAAAIVTESGTGVATKIVRRQIGYAGLSGTPLDGIPDYVRCHASFLSISHFRNSSEHSPFAHARMPEPCIQELLGPRRYRHRSQASSIADQIDDNPASLPGLQLVQFLFYDFRTSQPTTQK